MMGPRGQSIRGQDGRDGSDAPYVVAIDVEQDDAEIVFAFRFSDGTRIETDKIELPYSNTTYVAAGMSGGGGGVREYEILIDEASATVLYVGKSQKFGATTTEAVWQIKKILTSGSVTSIEFADSSPSFINVWDDRVYLTYG